MADQGLEDVQKARLSSTLVNIKSGVPILIRVKRSKQPSRAVRVRVAACSE